MAALGARNTAVLGGRGARGALVAAMANDALAEARVRRAGASGATDSPTAAARRALPAAAAGTANHAARDGIDAPPQACQAPGLPPAVYSSEVCMKKLAAVP